MKEINARFLYGTFKIGGNYVETISNRPLQVCCIYMCHQPFDNRSYQENSVSISSFLLFPFPGPNRLATRDGYSWAILGHEHSITLITVLGADSSHQQ